MNFKHLLLSNIVNCSQAGVKSYLLSVICYLLSVICYLLSVICYTILPPLTNNQ